MSPSAGSEAVASQPERPQTRQTRSQRSRLLWGAVVAGPALLLYLLTACRSLYWYDSAEFVAAAVELGIPHPPGYPLYTLVAHVFTWLPFNPPLAVALFSVLTTALNVFMLWVIQRRIGVSSAAAAISSLTFASAPIIWFNATVAEVYGPGLLAVLLTLWLVLSAYQEDRPWRFVGGALVAGLGLGFHLFGATVGLGYIALIAAWIAGPNRRRGGRVLLRGALVCSGCALAAALGSLNFLYLMWRAAQAPKLNFGSPADWHSLSWMVSGGMYSQWFTARWDSWAHIRSTLTTGFATQLTLLGVVFASVGLFQLVLRRRPLGVALLLGCVGNTAFFWTYNVHDRAVFFMPSVTLLFMALGIGLDTSNNLAKTYWRRLRTTTPGNRDADRPYWLWGLRRISVHIGVAGAALLSITVARTVSSYPEMDLSEFTEAEDFARAIETQIPKNAFILNYTTPPEWKYDAVFGFYYHRLHNLRPDIQIVWLPTDAYVQALFTQHRDVFAYDKLGYKTNFITEKEGPLYRVRPAMNSGKVGR